MDLTEGQQTFVLEHRFAVLATLRKNGGPQSTPVYYIYKDGKFYVSSTKDRIKTINIRRDSRVNLCILHESFPFRYVQVQGQARVTDEDLEARSRLIYGTFTETLADDFPDQLAKQGRIIIEITPENAAPDIVQQP